MTTPDNRKPSCSSNHITSYSAQTYHCRYIFNEFGSLLLETYILSLILEQVSTKNLAPFWETLRWLDLFLFRYSLPLPLNLQNIIMVKVFFPESIECTTLILSLVCIRFPLYSVNVIVPILRTLP